jgi:hypothetical protein
VEGSGTALKAPGIHQGYVVRHIFLFSKRLIFYNFCCLPNTLSQGERLTGAISSIKARAPVTGGNFGIWGGMFSTFDCAVKGWRQKEDAWNAIISGFLTGGCLAARSKSRPSTLS